MTKSRDEYVQANRAAWDASAPHHRHSKMFADLSEGFAKPGYSWLDPIITKCLAEIDVAGKDVAQLCCNNGREILSIKNLGAGTCVGFDQATGFLEQAREFAALGDIDCDFVDGDVYQIPPRYDGSFDIVVVTIGVFGWMPDVAAFIAIAARLLRPGGTFLVYEQHPITNMFEPWDTDDPHRLINSYFKAEPFAEEGAIVYEGEPAPGGPTKYWFVHTMADIITGCLKHGLAIKGFQEFPHNISSSEYDVYNDQPAQLPQSFTLVARKSGS